MGFKVLLAQEEHTLQFTKLLWGKIMITRNNKLFRSAVVGLAVASWMIFSTSTAFAETKSPFKKINRAKIENLENSPTRTISKSAELRANVENTAIAYEALDRIHNENINMFAQINSEVDLDESAFSVDRESVKNTNLKNTRRYIETLKNANKVLISNKVRAVKRHWDRSSQQALNYLEGKRSSAAINYRKIFQGPAHLARTDAIAASMANKANKMTGL
jgi:hypothetical protein